MSKQIYKVLLFYRYVVIDDPEKVKNWQKDLCQSLNLKGRIIVASEGINATIEGKELDIKKYIENVKKDPQFKDIHFKISAGNGDSFSKLSVKVRNEIVAARLGSDDVNPNIITGKYITAEELHGWFSQKKKFYIIDMRNDFEQRVGNFEGSILPGMETFADLPKILPNLKSLKDQTIVTVCTGGVRCEKASGFLIKHGFSDVYQLYGGIVTYMEKYPNEHFKGSLYVFDNRLVMGFNQDDSKKEIIGKCDNCLVPSENYINCKDDFCHRHFIACKNCLNGEESIFCPMGCRKYEKHLENA